MAETLKTLKIFEVCSKMLRCILAQRFYFSSNI